MIYIILASVLYSIAIMLGAFASRKADPTLVSGLTNVISAILPFMVLAKNFKSAATSSSKYGLIAALIGGVAISIFVIFLNKAFSTDKLAIVTPVVFGGSIFLTSIMSFFLYKEKISLIQGIGLLLVFVGIGFIIWSKLKA